MPTYCMSSGARFSWEIKEIWKLMWNVCHSPLLATSFISHADAEAWNIEISPSGPCRPEARRWPKFFVLWWKSSVFFVFRHLFCCFNLMRRIKHHDQWKDRFSHNHNSASLLLSKALVTYRSRALHLAETKPKLVTVLSLNIFNVAVKGSPDPTTAYQRNMRKMGHNILTECSPYIRIRYELTAKKVWHYSDQIFQQQKQ